MYGQKLVIRHRQRKVFGDVSSLQERNEICQVLGDLT
jgi:hypothetical protein